MKTKFVDLSKIKSGGKLPDEAVLARLCTFIRLNEHDGSIMDTAFEFDPIKEKYLSIYCLDYFKHENPIDQLRELREICNPDKKRMTIGKSAKFVIANVEFWRENFNLQGYYKPEGVNDFPEHAGLFPIDNNFEKLPDTFIQIAKFMNKNSSEFIIPASEL